MSNHSSETLDVPARRWTARFIAAETSFSAQPVLAKAFALDPTDPVVAASLSLTYLGIGRTRINGSVVGDDVLEPGWQSYDHRLVYRTYDVTSSVAEGRNSIVVELAPGWYAGRLGFFQQKEIYGTDPAAFAELRVTHASGAETLIATDESWTSFPGPTLHADLYDGETHDARVPLEIPVEAAGVVEVPFDLSRIEPAIAPPVRRIETIAARSISTSPSGKTLVDFGRNVVGWTRIRVTGDEGSEVTIRHAEVLEGGEIGDRPLRSAKATDRYILRGGGATEEWEPAFTYHGFRYVEVSGWPDGTLDPADIEAVVVHSDLRRTGTFRTEHAALAQLHSNVVASLQGNFVSIPTDCPQRDERLGWTGDIAVFAKTALFLYDATDFLRSWLRDVALEQRPDGRVPIFVPEVPFPPEASHIDQFGEVFAAVWGDATTMVPTALYGTTADVSHLSESYMMMRAWVDGVAAQAGPGLICDTGFQFGDWLDPTAPPDDPAAGRTETSLVATAYFAYSARLLADAARALDKPQDVDTYAMLARDVAAAFTERFVTDERLMTSDSQTAYALALCLDLVPERMVPALGERLIELVRADGHRIATGFVGTPLILDALTRAGAVADAYRLLLQEECPSWLYAVNRGATTIWERWDSMLPDGSINPGEMTSFNHYALGAVADWLHTTVAGLSALSPGWDLVRIAPHPTRLLGSAGATYETSFGSVSTDWRIDGDTVELRVKVPAGVCATVELPGVETVSVGEGHHEFRSPLIEPEAPVIGVEPNSIAAVR